MTIEKRLIEGIISASKKTWRYRKDLLEIRPEYLLTVAAADKLTDGFDGISGLDIQITLEARTRDICFDVMKSAVGLKEIIKGNRLRLSRKGRVDIFMTCGNRSWAIELKGFDPQKDQIEKELHRFIEILSANSWINGCEACFLAFPIRYLSAQKVSAAVDPILAGLPLVATYTHETHETGEDPGDGIAGFSIIVVRVNRNGV